MTPAVSLGSFLYALRREFVSAELSTALVVPKNTADVT
jgi:hypothetical protein